MGKHGRSAQFFYSPCAEVSLRESHGVVGYIYDCSVPHWAEPYLGSLALPQILKATQYLLINSFLLKRVDKKWFLCLQLRTPMDILHIQCLPRLSSYQFPKLHAPWLPFLDLYNQRLLFPISYFAHASPFLLKCLPFFLLLNSDLSFNIKLYWITSLAQCFLLRVPQNLAIPPSHTLYITENNLPVRHTGDPILSL